MGFYPVTPASVEYAAGAPLFPHAEIDFENGKKLMINAQGNNESTRYIKSVTFNGKPYTKNYYNHFDMQNGGVLNIQMSTVANKNKGTKEKEFPFSLSTNK